MSCLQLVECLFRARWTRLDGLGGLVLTPTRELALQIFEELVKVGKRHEMSAGLLIGGKNVKDEQSRVHAMNILIATPGKYREGFALLTSVYTNLHGRMVVRLSSAVVCWHRQAGFCFSLLPLSVCTWHGPQLQWRGCIVSRACVLLLTHARLCCFCVRASIATHG